MTSIRCRPLVLSTLRTAIRPATTATATTTMRHYSEKHRQHSGPEFATTVDSLKQAVRAGKDEELSNRQLFSRLKPDAKTLDTLDMLQLGTEKRGRFERRKWFRYNEPDVKLPHINFFAGALTAESFPAETLPEIGFVGRSNVGKSTLVNMLCGSSAARVSERPGLTQQINFYTADNDFHLVDMPGYGFAYAKEEQKQAWVPLIESYVRDRKRLKRVMLLLDARHGIKTNDREFMALLERTGTKYQVVMTKCDLVSRIDLAKRHLLVVQETQKARNCIPRVLMVSAKNERGLNELRKEILHTCGLGKKYLAMHKKKEVIARTEYMEQLDIFKETARPKKRRQ